MRAQAGAVTWSVFALRNTVLTGAGIQALAPLRVQHAKLVAMHHLDHQAVDPARADNMRVLPALRVAVRAVEDSEYSSNATIPFNL